MGIIGAAIGLGVLYHIDKRTGKKIFGKKKITLPTYKVPKGFKKKGRL